MGPKQSNEKKTNTQYNYNVSKTQSNYERQKTTTNSNNNNINSVSNNNKNKRTNTINANNITQTFICQKCKLVFYNNVLYNQHVTNCNKNSFGQVNNNPNKYSNNYLGPYTCSNCHKLFYSRSVYKNHCSICRNPNINNNNPQNYNSNRDNLFDIGNFIQNQLIKEPKTILPRGKADGTFEEKVQYLRYNLNERKIDWTKGSDKISVNRENILEQSINQFKKINPFKELKIDFKGEVSQDAGGLIREWLTVLFNILLDEKSNLFEKSDTDEISYIIKSCSNQNLQNNEKYEFTGKLLAKALLENLTVNCCFNKIIYQLFLNEKITLKDLVFIDKPLYNSMKNLIELKKNGDDLLSLELYFSIQYYENKKLITDELIQNGNNILVTSDNLDEYIEKRIEYLIKKQKNEVELIKKGFNTIIPLKELLIFNSDQLSLLINGTPFIDVDDWRLNTIYKNYLEYDNVIINFWEVLSNLTQNDLSNFLLFCTGSSRVPIGGFKTLESNRGNISKFCITKTEYVPNHKNFIKAHTCFNRLDLPNFPNENLLKDAIKFAIENETLGFGIE